MTSIRKICIVSSGTVSHNPRAVKEADALVNAGYDVSVVFVQQQDWTLKHDQAFLKEHQWRGLAVDITRKPLKFFLLRLRRKGYELLARLTLHAGIAENAIGAFVKEQLRMAVMEKADLYIGHNPAGLVAAALAAKINKVPYAFDAEDLHAGQYPSGNNSLELRLITCLENKYLPGCLYVTASAPGITAELRKRYVLQLSETILNVFPWSERQQVDGQRIDRKNENSPISFYWFSQIISLDRGLQDVIRALAQVDHNAVLHIRGLITPHVQDVLWQLAHAQGVSGRIFFHELVPAQALLSRAMEHDVGLCLEQPVILNRDLCVANKLFLYMLAGNAVIATRTRGHEAMQAIHPESMFLYQAGDVTELAAIMNRLITDKILLEQRKKSALMAAETDWHWEKEQLKLQNLLAGKTF